uniref:Uncharacterized protein n=1 Tax=Oryza sativa subsp. japonica TaxID=39947 RepID=Q7XII0_ORYSJ|nr:hypothetical protein [Oryza sativa Japonica Group]
MSGRAGSWRKAAATAEGHGGSGSVPASARGERERSRQLVEDGSGGGGDGGSKSVAAPRRDGRTATVAALFLDLDGEDDVWWRCSFLLRRGWRRGLLLFVPNKEVGGTNV